MPIEALWSDTGESRPRVERIAARLGGKVVPGDAYLGGGSAPDEAIEGWVLALDAPAETARRLRTGEPPVVGYQRDGRLILDLRTVDPADDEALATAVEQAMQQP